MKEDLILEIVKTNPIALLNLKKIPVDYIDRYLPFSIGFEIECSLKTNLSIEEATNLFKDIPDIMEVIIDSSEQRFRIPNGVKGLVCLFKISKTLKETSYLNLLSGIHYHCDCTSFYDLITRNMVESNKEWILNELDSWNYKGTYNKREINFNLEHNWVRFQSCFKTMEFRIGEMTFDYEVLIKRILHIISIVKDFKVGLTRSKEKLEFLQKKIIKINSKNEDLVKEITLEDIRNNIKNREVYGNT